MSEVSGTLADYIPDDRACVYAITNTVTGEQYIGSTRRLRRRLVIHRARLRNGTHPCQEMVAAAATHGLSAFRVEVLEPSENLHQLVDREQHFIDTLQPAYNKYAAARQPLEGPEYEALRAKKRAAALKRWQAPGARERASTTMQPINADPTLRRNVSKTTTARWQDPEYRAYHTERTRESQSKPEVREAKAERARDTWESSGRSEKMRAANVKRWQDPARRTAQSERLRKRWEDPAWRAHFAETQRRRKEQSSGGQA